MSPPRTLPTTSISLVVSRPASVGGAVGTAVIFSSTEAGGPVTAEGAPVRREDLVVGDEDAGPTGAPDGAEDGDAEGDAVEGDVVEGDVVEGDVVEGDAVEGDAVGLREDTVGCGEGFPVGASVGDSVGLSVVFVGDGVGENVGL